MLILLFCSQRSQRSQPLLYYDARALVSLRTTSGMGTVGNMAVDNDQ